MPIIPLDRFVWGFSPLGRDPGANTPLPFPVFQLPALPVPGQTNLIFLLRELQRRRAAVLRTLAKIAEGEKSGDKASGQRS